MKLSLKKWSATTDTQVTKISDIYSECVKRRLFEALLSILFHLIQIM